MTAKVSELENQLKSMQSQAESLQGSKAEEQSKKAAGEASVLTDAEKQGIASSQQAAKLTLSQSADSLEEAKAGHYAVPAANIVKQEFRQNLMGSLLQQR